MTCLIREKDSILELFLFETTHLLEQLEKEVLNSEKGSGLKAAINEIFRIMHTIKGAAAMMNFNNIATISHAAEDLFYYLREEKIVQVDESKITDIVLSVLDFIKNEVIKIEAGKEADGEAGEQLENIKKYLQQLKEKKENGMSNSGGIKKYQVVIFFAQGAEMENVRAFTVVHNLKEIATEITFFPADIIENNKTAEIIQKEGFKIIFQSERGMEEIQEFFDRVTYLGKLEIEEIKEKYFQQATIENVANNKQSLISVSISKLDRLMDLVAELVIAEAMVTGNSQEARQLKKITNELQDVTMSMRMVSLGSTFQKMKRLVRDMSKKMGKEMEIEIIGEQTEVDKNIIEHIADPLMHIIRNALDHGIESREERVKQGKSEKGKIRLEAKNAGGDVWIIVNDDGRGLDKKKIIDKAKQQGLLSKPAEEMSEKEIYALILLPGFSTKEQVSEFSGRGVGMDIVVKNLEKIRGTVFLDSVVGQGTTISIKIPLTLAIIEGMTIQVGSSKYTIPLTAVKESFRVKAKEIIKGPTGQEMILVRGECYPILRLHSFYKISTEITALEAGILLMIEYNGQIICLFADIILGQQQVVVKNLPKYLPKIKGIVGCTLLGDGSISLILDMSSLMEFA